MVSPEVSLPVSLPMSLMVRPFAGYRALAASHAAPSLAASALRFLLVLGLFVSVTATGRFAPFEVLGGMVSLAWLPLLTGAALAVTVRLLAPCVPLRRAFALYLQAQGPWFLVFLFLSGACLFAPQPERPVFVFLGPLLLGAAAWTMLLTYAFYRAGLALSRVRAVLGTVVLLVGVLAFVLAYFLAAGQLWPIL